MLDLKVGECCKIPLYDNIKRKTKKERNDKALGRSLGRL